MALPCSICHRRYVFHSSSECAFSIVSRCLKKFGEFTMYRGVAGDFTSFRYVSQSNDGVSAFTSASVIGLFRFFGSRRAIGSIAPCANSVSIASTVAASLFACSGFSPASTNIFVTCCTYFARISFALSS